MKVQLVTPYPVSLLQRYGVTVRGNVTSVYPPYDTAHVCCLHETSGHAVTLPDHTLRTRRVRHQTRCAV
jgi:hypothetical protein